VAGRERRREGKLRLCTLYLRRLRPGFGETPRGALDPGIARYRRYRCHRVSLSRLRNNAKLP